jgi:hypothetical protein
MIIAIETDFSIAEQEEKVNKLVIDNKTAKQIISDVITGLSYKDRKEFIKRYNIKFKRP